MPRVPSQKENFLTFVTFFSFRFCKHCTDFSAITVHYFADHLSPILTQRMTRTPILGISAWTFEEMSALPSTNITEDFMSAYFILSLRLFGKFVRSVFFSSRHRSDFRWSIAFLNSARYGSEQLCPPLGRNIVWSFWLFWFWKLNCPKQTNQKSWNMINTWKIFYAFYHFIMARQALLVRVFDMSLSTYLLIHSLIHSLTLSLIYLKASFALTPPLAPYSTRKKGRRDRIG